VNSTLLEAVPGSEDKKLRELLQEQQNFVIVPTTVWDKLIEW